MSTRPEPIFAAIADFRPYGDALNAAIATQNEPAIDAAWRPAYDRLNAIYLMSPETPAGLLALMELMLEWDGDHLRLTSERRSQSAMDAADSALVAVFLHSKRLLEAMR